MAQFYKRAVPSTGMSQLSLEALRAVVLPDIVRVDALAHFLDMAPEAILRELQAGKMPGRCLDGEWIVSRKAVFEWLYSRRAGEGEQR